MATAAAGKGRARDFGTGLGRERFSLEEQSRACWGRPWTGAQAKVGMSLGEDGLACWGCGIVQINKDVGFLPLTPS